MLINHEQLHLPNNVDICYFMSHIFQHVVLTKPLSEDYNCQGSGTSQQYPCICTEHSSVLCGSYVIAMQVIMVCSERRPGSVFHIKKKLYIFINSLIPLACAGFNNSLLFSGAPSIPLCYILFPAPLPPPSPPHTHIYIYIYIVKILKLELITVCILWLS